MKKLLRIAILGALPFTTFAQTEKGQGIWTGRVAVAHTSFKQEVTPYRLFNRSTESSLSLDRGIFFKDNWLTGMGVNVGWNTARQGYDARQLDPTESDVLGIGATGFIRRYWGKEKWRVFLGGGLSFGYSISKYVSPTTVGGNTFTMNPISQVGANYFVTDRIGLEASTMSTSFPFQFSGLNIGLVVLTGGNKDNPVETYEAPQTAKGRWLLGGGFGFTTSKPAANQTNVDDERVSSFTISPSVGWFVKKNLVMGLAIPVESRWATNGTYTLLGFSPYLKKYFSDNRLRPFVGGGLSYLLVRNQPKGADSYTSSSMVVSGYAGLAYLLGNRFIVDASLAAATLVRNYYPERLGIRSSTINVSASLQPNFTITYVFR
ncbi:hypothetical protein ACFPMF_05395 [Larkinella bovis]|uniref:Outer membrane protein beta-barrel domain-containing protein n=1 Tax=Larkinella bovis TaxID=683041 RepID=A0ABW0I5C9_9BACT